jgi:acetylornithine aminotransferase
MDELRAFPQIQSVRGRGLMIGIEFEEDIKDVRRKLLFEEKVFTGVAGNHIIRLLPPLCLTKSEASEFLEKLQKVLG